MQTERQRHQKRQNSLKASLALGCGALAGVAVASLPQTHAAGPAKPAATAAGDESPPRLRLGDAARPTRYAAELTVVPTQESFRGVVDIDVTVAHAVRVLWLNAEELSISRAEFISQSAGAKSSVVATVLAQPKDFVGLRTPQPLAPGSYRLHLEYSGKMSAKDSGGAGRHKEGGEWYVTTHFEPIDARRVFPCFDEPGFKVPWQLNMVVRSTDKALTNTRQLRETDIGGGMKRVEFAPTQPLPSYLIAWAVGPFDIVDAGKSARSGTPVRVVTPRGQQAQAAWAGSCSAELLSLLEEYFGINYPYDKMDVVAVPMLGGAMEHPGLVTFDQTLLLNSADRDTIGRKRAYADVATHEFAHQWFGDLVTTQFWDDLWLNEAFATWMTPKIIERWQPSWGSSTGRVFTRNGAMGTDSMITARQIRQPIETNNDIKNAFDGITYGKGASVIAMFERWIGAAAFQKGVQRYMREHAHGNATARDFLAAISAEAGRDIAPAFATFLDQAGVPLLRMDLTCQAGGPTTLKWAQSRYLPEGSEGAAQAAGQLWQVPVCVRWKAGQGDGRACTLAEGREGQWTLPGVVGCPAMVVPNEQAAGYYRTLLGGDWMTRLLADGGKSLTLEERVGTVSDLTALVRAGQIPYGDALPLTSKLAQDESRFVVEMASSLVAGLRDGQLLPESLLPSYARFVRDAFGARARRLGWQPKAGENDDTRLLRNELLPLVADQGDDRELQAEATRLAQLWLKDRRAINAEIVDGVLRTAVARGDRALFEQLHAKAQTETDRRQRNQMLRAMGGFSDPQIVQTAMDLTLASQFEPREAMALIWGATRRPATRKLAYDFIKTHFDALVAKLPRDAGANFPFIGATLCEEAARQDIETFFRDRAPRFTGGPRLLSQALERVRLCSAFRRSQTPSVTAFFQKIAAK